MIKISELAKICGTTTHTLRYYDSAGVLCADRVDSESGYRYYTLEAVERFKKIAFYKEMGFSLEEIKALFSLSPEEAQKKLTAKKSELSEKVNKLNNNIATIDTMVNSPERFYPSINDLFTLPFENDAEVIGKWTICGRITDKDNVFASLADVDERDIDTELYFLPGGAPAWRYLWTKGVLYRMAPRYNFAIPNKYKIIIYNEEKYMIIDYVLNSCVDRGFGSVPILYRQVDGKVYTELDIRKRKDKTDLPYEDDEDVLGVWSVCDYIPNIGDFDENSRYTPDEECYTRAFEFSGRGVCIKTQRAGKRNNRYALRYTKAFVLNDKDVTAEEYFIKMISDTEYLFVQHKSGDYYYGGAEPHWYVFKRKE